MLRMKVPFYRHSLTGSDALKIQSVLDSPFLTSGPVCKAVETQLTEYFSVKHAKLVNSWTNGAVATLLALDIGPGDEVIVPAMTFIATANIVELVGAKPIFIDCHPETFLMTPELVLNAFTPNTRAIIPVHMYGQMCDVEAIKKIIPKNQKIYIIEDCAHSFESKLNGNRPGVYSDAAIFSFYATKNITCGEGGAIITNDSNLFERIIQTVHHGMSANAADRYNTGQYRHWDMLRLGTKANLSDILASLLKNQINCVDNRIEKRNLLAQRYEKSLEGLVKIVKTNSNTVHARHLFTVGVNQNIRDEVIFQLGIKGIGTTVNYRAITETQYYRKKYQIQKNQNPVSVDWGLSTISLPMYYDLSTTEQDYVIQSLSEILSEMSS